MGRLRLCQNLDIWRNVFHSMSDIWRLKLHQHSCLTVDGARHIVIVLHLHDSALAGRRRCNRHLIELLLVSVAVGLADWRVIEIARDKPVNES
jgi:hypothetical protein